MIGLRFSLRSLLASIAVVGIALASLLQAWQSWYPAVLSSIVLFLLLLSLPASIYLRGRERAFYAGFALVGSGYFLLTYAPWFEASVGRQLLAMPIAEAACFAVTDSLGDLPQFLRLTHALFMFVAACVGGLTASHCYARSTQESSTDERSNDTPATSSQDSTIRSKELSLRRAQ